MADYLPPVVARLSMDMGDFMAGIAKAKAEIKSLNSTVKIGADSQALAMMLQQLRGINVAVRENTDGLGALAAKTAAAKAATATATAVMINGWRLTGTALHWAISGGAELLAVTIPAVVALGAGLAVMGPAAQNAQLHMQALFTATQADQQMFGKTAGDALGLGHALKTAQDAAQPQVYGILGSALIAVKGHMGELTTAGTKVSQMFQTFAAKLAVDFGPQGNLGSKTTSLFAHMTTDLQGLGQVLGNIAHVIVNVASSMPGLAEFLLKGLSGITGFLSHLSGAAPILITVGLALEELWRYAGLAARVVGLLGTGFATLLKAAGLAEAAAKITGISKALQDLLKTPLGKFQIAGIAALAVGIGILIDKAVTARTVIQEMGDAMQAAVLKASNSQGMSVALNNIGQLNSMLRVNQQAAGQAAVGGYKYTAAWEAASRVAVIAQNRTSQLNSVMQQQQQDVQNTVQGAALIAKTYGTTFVGALALADEANVKLANGITGTSQAAMIARMQIAGLVQGYAAMGQSSGQVGADMTALAIQSGLAATNVGKLNSAWDSFIGNLTGGTGALSSFVLNLDNISNAAGNAHSKLSQLTRNQGIKDFANQLNSFGKVGAQAWQNFNQLISSGNSLLDWMRTAGAEGALSASQFKQAGLDMASALIPFAQSSKTAQAELLGLVQEFDPAISTFSQLKSAVQNSGASLGGLGGIISKSTQAMANMQSVAQTLGTSLAGALTTALQAAQVQASGAGAAMQKYAQDLMDANTAAEGADYATLLSDLEKLGLSAQQAAAMIQSVTQNLNNMPTGKTITITTVFNNVGSPAGPGVGKLGGHTGSGFAAGTPAAPSGWAWVGEAGPELVKFRGGETVLPNQVSMGFAGGAGLMPMGDIHLYMDGREISGVVAKRAVVTQRRTGHNGFQKRTR